MYKNMLKFQNSLREKVLRFPRIKKILSILLVQIKKIECIYKIAYAKKALFKLKKNKNIQYIVCPCGIGDTMFLASLIHEYKLCYQKEKVFLIVKKSQKDIPDFFEDVNGKIVSSHLVECLVTYSKKKKIFNKNNYQYGHFILDSDWPEPGQLLGIKDLNLIDIYKRCVLKISMQAVLSYPKILVSCDVMKDYINRYYTNKKVIVLYPYAVTLKQLNNEFWIGLAKKFISEGYQVYTNTKNYAEKAIKGTEALCLSIKEIYIVSRTLKWECIALRSGICDLLAFSDIKLTVIFENEMLRIGWHMENIGLPNCNIKDIVVNIENIEVAINTVYREHCK